MSRWWCRWIVAAILVVAGMPLAHAGVVISEIMYHPASDDDADEFVELVNAGTSLVDLSDWCMDGVDLCFPPGTSLPAGERLVLAADAAAFTATYGTAADFIYLGKLSNDGEALRVLDAGGQEIDAVTYADVPPWAVTPDGLGPSLELIDPAEDNDQPRAWRASVDASGHTAGVPNSVAATGLPPWIAGVSHTLDALPGQPVVVTATVLDASAVDLVYRIDFEPETTLPMLDDGASDDGAPGDGVHGAVIPGQLAGTLVRYRIVATGATGTGAHPRSDDTVTYDGTLVEDPALVSPLPVIHWFIDPLLYQAALDHKFTDLTEPAVCFYDGRLYDAIEIRVRGQSSRAWPKKNWKFFFPQGHAFAAPDLLDLPVDNINLQASYGDKAYLREHLGYSTFAWTGIPASQTHYVRLHQNGVFFGLYVLVEDPDRTWVQRNGLDPNAARYKAFDDLRDRGGPEILVDFYGKQSRLYEDYSDLHDLIVGLNALTGTDKRDFVFDNIDIPRTLNYIATNTIIHNNDHVTKNYFLYRDTEGTARWSVHPWDHDLTFGRNFSQQVLNDLIWADYDVVPGFPNNSPSHPRFGDSTHRKIDGFWNRLIDAMHEQPDILEMYHRRLRTLMDQLLVDGFYEARIDSIVPVIAGEAETDRQLWGQYGVAQDLATAVDALEIDYLTVRRTHLFDTHRVLGEIPDAQSAQLPVVINEVMYNPTGGPDHDFIELYNVSATEAVDLSGWRLDGVASTLPGGAVILPRSFALLVANDVQFRANYGGGKFVLAQFEGSLSDVGETLVLRRADGQEASAVTFTGTAPWPTSPAGGGPSLELRDPQQETDWVANWGASTVPGGSPGAPNTIATALDPFPGIRINEVLPVNVSVLADEQGDFDPWIELFNTTPGSVDVGGMLLADSFSPSSPWEIPAGTSLCGGCWLLVWADAEPAEGPLHADFALSSSGGSVALFDAGGTLLDFLDYGSPPSNASFGRFPDGGRQLRTFANATPLAANDAAVVPLILNEYNAVAPGQLLQNAGSDTFWGTVAGNGGDWFELVVTADRLDLRGWELRLTDDTGGVGETSWSLLFSDAPVWADVAAGTIITVAEDLPDDVGYDPAADDWWIHVQAADAAGGAYVTAQDFSVSNANWQLTIRDDLGNPVFGPVGEGIQPVSGVGSDEVFKLEEDPGPFLTPFADYNDGSSSTFGSPNVYAGGTMSQDFSMLRCVGQDCSSLDAPCTLGVCNGATGLCEPVALPDGAPCEDGDLCTTDDTCSAGACVATPQDCSGLDGDCSIGLCNPDDGACLAQPINEGLSCDDGDVCSQVDTCSAGTCQGSDPLDCDDGDACTSDTCDAVGGCENLPLPDADLDGECDLVDNCVADANPGQDDADADGHGDVCDNCPADANLDQADQDGDLIGDACDCAPADPTDPIPPEVGNTLVLDRNGGTALLAWDDQAMPEPFRLYRGFRLVTQPFVYNQICVGDPIAADHVEDALVPSASRLLFYLVARENACGASVLHRGTEGSPIPDAGTCPGQPDADGDGFDEIVDTCPGLPDPSQEDTDGDGHGDLCDNCAQVPNVYQRDVDLDGQGDACDDDADADSILDDGGGTGSAGDDPCTGGSTIGCDDNCRFVPNADQADGDADGVGDLCDNCPDVYNPWQMDMDFDGLGNECDPD